MGYQKRYEFMFLFIEHSILRGFETNEAVIKDAKRIVGDLKEMAAKCDSLEKENKMLKKIIEEREQNESTN